MKIEQLRLDRYGMHENVTLDLPATGSGLHLLVGPNEAGKSTARKAIGDLVFGFPKSTPQAYLHKMSSLQVGARVHIAGEMMELVRLKKNKDSLQDPAGQPLRLDPFAAVLSGLSREDFERDYCLGLEELTEGSRMIMTDQADSARTLFAAASGVSGIKPLMETITEEADRLFAPRGAGHRAYYQAEEAFHAANKAAKDATLRRSAWNKLEREAEAAQLAMDKATEAHKEANKRLARLKRIQAAAPKVRQIEQLGEELASLTDAPEMPKGAQATLDAALDAIRDADAAIKRDTDALQTLTAEANALQVDDNLSAMEADSRKLEAIANGVEKHGFDIVRQRDRAAEQLALARETARSMGWSATSPEELQAMLPTELALRELRAAGAALNKATDELKRLTRQTQVAADQIKARRKDLVDVGEVTSVSERWSVAADSANALGDVPSRLEAMRLEIDAQRQRVIDSLGNLAPWAGGIDSLPTLRPLPQEEAQAVQNNLQGLDAHLTAQRQGLEQLQGKLVAARDALLSARSGQSIPSQADILAARERRNGAWEGVKGTPGDAGKATVFEQRMVAADEVCDQRFERSEDAHRVDTLQSRSYELEQEIGARSQEFADLESERDQCLAQWKERLKQAGLPDLAPADYPPWLIAYHQTLSLLSVLQEGQAQRRDLEAAQQKAWQALKAAMQEDSAWREEFEGAALATLVHQCSARKLAHKEAEVARAATLKQIREAEVQHAQAERDHTEAQAEHQAAKEAWKLALLALGLPVTTSVEAAQVVHDGVPKLREALGLCREAQSRVDGMQRDLNSFKDQANEAAARASLVIDGMDAMQIQRALAKAVGSAVDARNKLSGIKVRIDAAETSLEQARQRKSQAVTRTEPLTKAAGSSEEAVIRTAIARHERKNQAEEQLRALKEHLATIAAGVPEEQLLNEVTGADLDGLEAELAVTNQSVATISVARDQALQEAGRAAQALDAERGTRGSASAVGDREAAVAGMAAAISDYIPLTIMNALLDWSMNRYREKHQDPLLARATDIFAILTNEEYRQVTVSEETDAGQLTLIKASGAEVESRALSAGARDQLFLALRIAALELHLDSGAPALPFVADDLFVNFDDERAAAGFRVLARLAQRTQVIYITHHQHLVDVAKAAIADDINVVPMSRAVIAANDEAAAA